MGKSNWVFVFLLGMLVGSAPVRTMAQAGAGDAVSVLGTASPFDAATQSSLQEIITRDFNSQNIDARIVISGDAGGYKLPDDGRNFLTRALRVPVDFSTPSVVILWVKGEGKAYLVSSPSLSDRLTGPIQNDIVRKKIMPALYSGRYLQAMSDGFKGVHEALEGRYVLEAPQPKKRNVRALGVLAVMGVLLLYGMIRGVIAFFRMDTSGVGYSGDPLTKLNDRYRRDHPPRSDPWD